MSKYVKTIAVCVWILFLHGQTFSQEISARLGVAFDVRDVVYNDTVSLDFRPSGLVAIAYADTLSSKADYWVGIGNYSKGIVLGIDSPVRGFSGFWRGEYIYPLLGVRYWFKTERKGLYTDLEVMPAVLVDSPSSFVEGLDFSSFVMFTSARVGYRLVVSRRLSLGLSLGIFYRIGDVVPGAESPNALARGSVLEVAYHF